MSDGVLAGWLDGCRPDYYTDSLLNTLMWVATASEDLHVFSHARTNTHTLEVVPAGMGIGASCGGRPPPEGSGLGGWIVDC